MVENNVSKAKSGKELEEEVLSYVKERSENRRKEVKAADIYKHFADNTPGQLSGVLNRMKRNGVLGQPKRGYYLIAQQIDVLDKLQESIKTLVNQYSTTPTKVLLNMTPKKVESFNNIMRELIRLSSL